MKIEFDPSKNAANIEKHGISLARAADLEVLAALEDDRFSDELTLRAYGLIDGAAYCLAYTVRGENIRAISSAGARSKEMKRYVP